MQDAPLPEHAAFIRAIRESPGDDTPRLAYADWLEEQGDPDRAEFIRVQCWLAAARPDHPEWEAFRARERHILAAHQDRWWAPFGDLLYREPGWYDRGFLSFMGVYRPVEFVTCWDALLDLTPTRRLVVGWTLDGDAGPLGQCPGLAQIAELWTNDEGGTFPMEDFGPFVRSPFAQNLTRLELGCSQWRDPVDCELLAAAPLLPHLQYVQLALAFPANPEVVIALLRSPHRGALRGLEVWYFTDADIEALCSCAALSRLTHLDFGCCAISDAGARRLLECPYLTGIEYLSLGGTEAELSTHSRTALRGRFGQRVSLEPEIYMAGQRKDLRRWELVTGRPQQE